MMKPQTFLIISLPHVEEEKIYKLEVEYVVLTATLTNKESALLRTCVESPFHTSDDTRGGGSELLFAHYLVAQQKNVVWHTRTLTARSEPFALHEIDSKNNLKQWWVDMPAHDVCLVAQIVRECAENDAVDVFEHLDHCKCIIEQRRTKRARCERGEVLSQFEKDVLELTEEDFFVSSDDDTLSTIAEELEEGEIK